VGKSFATPFHEYIPFMALENWDCFEEEFNELRTNHPHFFEDGNIEIAEKFSLCASTFEIFRKDVLTHKNGIKQGG
jgi:hypothetical protein